MGAFETGTPVITWTDVKSAPAVVKTFELSQNYPNPFNPSTKIIYSLAKTSHVSLKIFNLLGQEIATLVDGNITAGQHEVTFNASRLSSGVYIYTLRTGENVSTKKMTLLK
jgi:hypothetical protein